MDFTGRYLIPAPPETVWAAIHDPEVLRICIPGCQSISKTDETHFEAAVQLKIGPVRATFKGKVGLENPEPPRRVVLKGEGQGGVAGFARGEAEVELESEPSGTTLTYTARVSVGGKLAQIGQRLIGSAAKQLADEFFAKFTAAIAETPAPEEPLSSTTELVELPVAAPSSQRAREGLAPEIWIVGLIAVIVILLGLFGLSL